MRLIALQLCSCAGQPLLELIEVLLKAAVHMKNMSPKSSSDACTFVRTKCSGEGSDAAWAIERILEYVVKEKGFLYNHFSPMARSVHPHFRTFSGYYLQPELCETGVNWGSSSLVKMVNQLISVVTVHHVLGNCSSWSFQDCCPKMFYQVSIRLPTIGSDKNRV